MYMHCKQWNIHSSARLIYSVRCEFLNEALDCELYVNAYVSSAHKYLDSSLLVSFIVNIFVQTDAEVDWQSQHTVASAVLKNCGYGIWCRIGLYHLAIRWELTVRMNKLIINIQTNLTHVRWKMECNKLNHGGCVSLTLLYVYFAHSVKLLFRKLFRKFAIETTYKPVDFVSIALTTNNKTFYLCNYHCVNGYFRCSEDSRCLKFINNNE